MPQCQHMIETSRSNSLRALYGEGGLSRERQCKRTARWRFTVPGTSQQRDLCRQHGSDEFLHLACMDPWIVTDITSQPCGCHAAMARGEHVDLGAHKRHLFPNSLD